MAGYADFKIFKPEFMQILFQQVEPPERPVTNLFGTPLAMGMHQFSVGKFEDPFMILPPVEDLEDAKSMMSDHEIEDYKLQDYRGFFLISNKIMQQYDNANNWKGFMASLKNWYLMNIKEAVANTLEYTILKALEAKAATLATSHDWTAGATTADNIFADISNAKYAYKTNTRSMPTIFLNNEVAMKEMEQRKDISGQLYTGKRTLVDGALGDIYGLSCFETAPDFTDHEGNDLTAFAPTTAGKNLTWIFTPQRVGKPVVFGQPTFNAVEDPDKNAVRVYVNHHFGFVYNKPYVARITV